jgi:hypothetical protein
MSEDWRVDSHDKEIKQLKDDLCETKEVLREAKEKIWRLERRASAWVGNIKAALLGIVQGGLIAALFIAIASNH